MMQLGLGKFASRCSKSRLHVLFKGVFLMRKWWLLALLWGSVAWAQGKPGQPKPDAEAPRPAASSVAPDAPVITIQGLCESQKVTGSEPCQTVVSRAQFEKLVDALEPAATEHTKSQIAHAYPEFLVMAQEAERRGIDKSARFEERLAFARLQILSQELVRQIQLQAADVPDKDIEDYYKNHAPDFQTANLERIVIPLRGENDKVLTASMKKEAETLRARAAAGEDFSKLQKAAYDAAGLSGNTAPDPNLRDMRRRSLPLTHATVFDLKPGEVSAVIADSTGYYIYKMDSKGMVSLSAAHKEIWNTLRAERSKKMIESVEQPFPTEINHAYFTGDPNSEKLR
jgi:hypothetical protein